MQDLKGEIRKWMQQLGLTKKEKVLIVGVLIGAIILTLLLLMIDNQPLSGSVSRNTYGEGDRTDVFRISVIDEEENQVAESLEITLEIGERIYTEEEQEEAFAQCIEALDALILGENESADAIYYDLNLPTEVSGFPMEISWSWSPYEVLNVYGEIQEEYVVEEGILVELVGTLSYEDTEVEYVKYLYIFPAPETDEETLIRQIQALVVTQDGEKVTEDSLQLPEVMGEYQLTWYGEVSYRGLGILLIGIGVVTLLLWKKEQEKKQGEQERTQQMIQDYPQIIYTLSLYIGAGMTVKNAWKRIALEKDKERYAFMEMKTTYYEMLNGLSELECYENFGRRCKIRCYQRLGLLLNQNVRKGTKGLREILEREASEAYEDRKNRAKQEGEKAGTKLLMPMFLMLAVVLVIVVVPAFYSIQI